MIGSSTYNNEIFNNTNLNKQSDAYTTFSSFSKILNKTNQEEKLNQIDNQSSFTNFNQFGIISKMKNECNDLNVNENKDNNKLFTFLESINTNYTYLLPSENDYENISEDENIDYNKLEEIINIIQNKF